jgi:hypothetical protein
MAAKQAEQRDSIWLADRGVAIVTWAASAAALAMSYRGLYDFATQRAQMPGWVAVGFPLLLDSFLVVGELRLYSAVRRHEQVYVKVWAWALTAAGLFASLAGNIAHVGPAAPWAAKLAAAAAPLAAAASLGTGLGIAKLNAGKTDGREPGTEDGLSTSPARQPGKSKARRQPANDVPSYAQLAALAAQDEQKRKPMGRRSFAARHGISQHQARVFLASQQNGGGK